MPANKDIQRRLGLLPEEQKASPVTLEAIQQFESAPISPINAKNMLARIQKFEEAEAQQEAADRGFVGEIIAAGKRGVAQTWGDVGIPVVKTIGEVLQSPGEELGPIEQWAMEQQEGFEAWARRTPEMILGPEYQDPRSLKGAVVQGVEQAMTSLTARAPATIAGGLLGGGIPGAILGYIASGGTLFGAAEYSRRLDEADEAGISREESAPVALESALYEAGGEVLSDLIFAGAMKFAPGAGIAKEALKGGLKTVFATGMKETLARWAAVTTGEVAGEMSTAAMQAQAARKINLGDQDMWEAAKDVMGPTAVASILFFGLVEAGARQIRRDEAHTLQDPDASKADRLAVSRRVQKALAKADPEIAQVWANNANELISKGLRIQLDTDLTKLPEGPKEEVKERPAGPIPTEEKEVTEELKRAEKELQKPTPDITPEKVPEPEVRRAIAQEMAAEAAAPSPEELAAVEAAEAARAPVTPEEPEAEALPEGWGEAKLPPEVLGEALTKLGELDARIEEGIGLSNVGKWGGKPMFLENLVEAAGHIEGTIERIRRQTVKIDKGHKKASPEKRDQSIADLQRYLAEDLTQDKYQPIMEAPAGETRKDPVHGRTITNIHEHEGVEVGLEWTHRGAPNFWTAYSDFHAKEGREVAVGNTPAEAVANLREQEARQERLQKELEERVYTREELMQFKKMKAGHRIRAIARARGLSKAESQRLDPVIGQILEAQEAKPTEEAVPVTPALEVGQEGPFEGTLYRGETPQMKKEGFRTDPGDFGRGLYWTSRKSRAKAHGEVREERVRLENPLRLTVEEAYDLQEEYGTTVRGTVEDRLAAAEAMTKDLLESGYDGLVVVNPRQGDFEVVDFRPYRDSLAKEAPPPPFATFPEEAEEKKQLEEIADIYFSKKAPAPEKPEPMTFRSGAEGVTVLEGYIDEGVPVGVEIGITSQPAEKRLVKYANEGGHIFVDSGAYKATQEEPTNFDKVLNRYDKLANSVKRENRPNLHMVMPDVLPKAAKTGDGQTETLLVQKKYSDRIKNLWNKAVDVIVPIQKGGRPPQAVWKAAMEAIGLNDVRIAIPMNKGRFTEEDIRALYKDGEGPPKLHLLGITYASPRFQPTVDLVRELAAGDVDITADGGRLRAQIKEISQLRGEIKEELIELRDRAGLDDTEIMADVADRLMETKEYKELPDDAKDDWIAQQMQWLGIEEMHKRAGPMARKAAVRRTAEPERGPAPAAERPRLRITFGGSGKANARIRAVLEEREGFIEGGAATLGSKRRAGSLPDTPENRALVQGMRGISYEKGFKPTPEKAPEKEAWGTPGRTAFLDKNGWYIHVGKAPHGNFSFYRTKDLKRQGTRLKLRHDRQRFWDTPEEAAAALREYAKEMGWKSPEFGEKQKPAAPAPPPTPIEKEAVPAPEAPVDEMDKFHDQLVAKGAARGPDGTDYKITTDANDNYVVEIIRKGEKTTIAGVRGQPFNKDLKAAQLFAKDHAIRAWEGKVEKEAPPPAEAPAPPAEEEAPAVPEVEALPPDSKRRDTHTYGGVKYELYRRETESGVEYGSIRVLNAADVEVHLVNYPSFETASRAYDDVLKKARLQKEDFPVAPRKIEAAFGQAREFKPKPTGISAGIAEAPKPAATDVTEKQVAVVITEEITQKTQKKALHESIERAKKEAPKQTDTVAVDVAEDMAVFEVPGDGRFRVRNTKEALTKFQSRVKSHFPGKPMERDLKLKAEPETPRERRVPQGKEAYEHYEYVAEYKPAKIVESTWAPTERVTDRNRGLWVDKNREWITQGGYALRRNPRLKEPEKFLSSQVGPNEGDFTSILIPEGRETYKAEIIAEEKGFFDQVHHVVISDGKQTITMNADFVDIIQTAWPGAEPYFVENARQTLWRQDDKWVGVTMPLRIGDQRQHSALMEDFIAERKINVPPPSDIPVKETKPTQKKKRKSRKKDDQEYMRSGLTGTYPGMKRDEVRDIVMGIVGPFYDSLDLHIKFLDDHTQLRGNPYRPETIKEVWDRPSNTIAFVASNIENREDAERTLAHALWGHVAPERWGGEKFMQILREVVAMYAKPGLREIAEDYGLDLEDPGHRFQAAREMIARMAEQDIKPNFMARVYSRIRDMMRDLGFTVKWSDNDIRDLLIRSRKAAERGELPARSQTPNLFAEHQDYSRTARDIWGTVGKITLGSKRRKFFGGPLKDAIPEHVRGSITGRHGMQMPDLKAQYEGMKQRIHENFMRHWATLDPQQFPHAQDLLRTYQEAAHAAVEEVLYRIKTWVGDLTPEQYDLFSLRIVFGDLLRDIESKVITPPPAGLEGVGTWLPFKFQSREEVEETLANIKELVEQDPQVAEALQKRNDWMRDFRHQQVDAKLLPEEVRDIEEYFHHQVLEYMEERRSPGVSSQDVRTKRRPYQIARKDQITAKDYNIEYVESEFEVLMQGLVNYETKETMDEIERIYDKSKELNKQAKIQNNVRYRQRWEGMYKNEEITPKEYEQGPFYEERRMIAGAIEKLHKMAYKGTLEGRGEFDDLVEDLRENWEEYRARLAEADKEEKKYIHLAPIDDPRFFEFYRYLIKNKMDGSGPAAAIFRAINSRENKKKEALGKYYTTWEQLARDRGLEVYVPQPHTAWHIEATFPESLLTKYFEGVRDLTKEDKKEVLVRGIDKKWAIPPEVAATMESFRRVEPGSWVGERAERLQSLWKQYILIMPLRVLKYNLNNLSGDLDIVIAAAPGILKYGYGAAKDLARWSRQKGDVSDIEEEMLHASKMAVTSSGWARVETPDVLRRMNERDFMKHISGEHPGFPAQVEKWYGKARTFTIWRENILRLAAYRYYKDKLKEVAKNEVELNEFGVSNPDEIRALLQDGQYDRVAAKLARELVGDYGNISPAGQWLRAKVMPFYAWKEINIPRYYRLFRNIPHEGRSMGEMMPRMSAAFAKKGVGVAFKATLLYSAVSLYNSVVWPEEEEELGMTGRRQLHLILGRRPDGSIMTLRFQGALSDAMNWFGLEDFPDDVKDLASGKKNFYEWMKEGGKAFTNVWAQGIGPQYKTPAEIATGRALWPDVFKPKPIRDRVEHVFRVLAVEKLYNEFAGKPTRGESVPGKLFQHISQLLVYTADPQEIAYHEIRQEANKFLERHQLVKPSVEPTKRSNALYYYKQALKYGDVKAAEKYLQKYVDLKGTTRGLKISIRLAHPLAGIPVKYRQAFVHTLDPEDRRRLRQALGWYENTYLKVYRGGAKGSSK